MQIYNVYQSGKRLYIDEKENPDNKIVVNKYENEVTTLRLISDGTLPPRLYWALRNPKLSNKYFILKLVNNEDLIVGTDISATPGLWDMLLIGTDEDYIIEGADIDQSRLTYVSDHFGRLFVRDNFLEELDFEEQCSPTFKVFYDEIMFQLDNIPDLSDIPDKMSDLENDTNFISGVAFKDDGQGNVEIIGTTFSGGETEEGEIPSGGNVEVDDELDEKSTNPVQNKVIVKEIKSLKQKDESLDKEVIALRERNAELEETIEKLQIKQTTDKAPFHHITDSANYRVLNFGMEGKTEQETTSGKNLFDAEYASDVNNWKVDTNGWSDHLSIPIYVGKGNAVTAKYHTILASGITNINTCICQTNDYFDTGRLWLYLSTSTVWQNVSRTITAIDDYVYLFCEIKGIQNGDFKNYIGDYLQIELGSTATDYEPYTNGPSPNPDYPQEIVNAGVYNEETGRYDHKCCVGNKNLFDLVKASDISNYVWGAIYPFFPVYVGKGNTVTFSCKLPTETTYHVMLYDNVDGNLLKYVWHSSSTIHRNDVITFISHSDYFYIRITISKKDDVIKWLNDFTDIQIEISDTQTDYAPHQSTKFTLTSDRPLTMWDNLVKRDGVWGWSVWDKTKEFTGNEDVTTVCQDDTGVTIYEIYVENIPQTYNNDDYYRSYCEQFYYVPGGQIADKTFTQKTCYSVQRRNFVQFASLTSDGIFESADTFKEYLQNEKVRIMYRSDTEVAFIPLPDEEQTLLNNLETYYGVTNVYNEQGCPITLSYISHPQLYVDQKLEQINSALLSLGANV